MSNFINMLELEVWKITTNYLLIQLVEKISRDMSGLKRVNYRTETETIISKDFRDIEIARKHLFLNSIKDY